MFVSDTLMPAPAGENNSDNYTCENAGTLYMDICVCICVCGHVVLTLWGHKSVYRVTLWGQNAIVG